MLRRKLLGFFSLVAIAALTSCASTSGGGGKWVMLFDGKNLDQWTTIGTANWRIEDGAVQANQGSGFLVSKNVYTDFEVRAEFWVDDKANSGVFIRCSDSKNVTASNGYEVNIFDTRPDPSYGTGAIVNVAKVSPMPKAGGKWNVYEIKAQGSTFTVTLNGVRTVDSAKDAQHPTGNIALQYGAGVVKFRKVQVRTL